MIFFIPLSDLMLFHVADLASLSEQEIVERIRSDQPELFADATLTVNEGVLRVEFQPVADAVRAEAGRLLEKGVLRCRQGEYRKAIGILERVIELDPSVVAAYRNLGMAYVELNESDKARDYLVEAALLDPRDPWPYVVLGNQLLKQPDKLEAAEALLRKAHELDPADPWAMNSLGGIATERGDLSSAQDWFRLALQLKPDFANSRYGLANSLAMAGRFEEARAELSTLFSGAEHQDARSNQVFRAARDFWLDITRQLANARRDASLASVRDYLARVSEASGYPVREEWADFPESYAAQTQMAWKKEKDHHLIRLRRGYPEPAWHHILAHEATHIAMEAEARALGRNRWFVTTAETRTKALKGMAGDIRRIGKLGYPEQGVAELMVTLHNGATSFLFNCPLDMIIEARLRREMPTVADAQWLSLDALAREAITVTRNPEVRSLSPQIILKVNDTLNAAMALFLRDLSGGAIDYVEAYRPLNCLKQAERIYGLYQAAVSRGLTAGNEYDLVDAFAAELGVRDWYVWQPDRDDLTRTQDDAGSPTPARRISSPAALMYLVAALDHLEGLDPRVVTQIATEAALLGRSGMNLDNADKLHTLSAFPDERFSGLELLCLMYAAFQQIKPDADVGVDMSEVWDAARIMHASRKR
jgi:Flp pilus assembly protein TadD